MRHEILIKLLTFHELEQHGDAFIIFHQPLGVAIEQRIRVDAGGIYTGNGFGQGLQVFFGRTLVGAKITVVFACKGIAKVVFQQAGRAHDQGTFGSFHQDVPQAFQDIIREFSVDKVAYDVRVIGTHLFFGLIFLITPMHQAIICNKDIIQVRCQEVGNRNTHGFPHVRRGSILQDPVC